MTYGQMIIQSKIDALEELRSKYLSEILYLKDMKLRQKHKTTYLNAKIETYEECIARIDESIEKYSKRYASQED